MNANQKILKLAAIACVAATVLSCNKNSTSWFNRKYQNMVARYNVYYNGTERLKEAVDNLALNHQDNYQYVLDVFPYGDESQQKAQAATMDEIIKKGSKIILDRPVSKWVDDAYMLVGKSYFFKAEYYTAIETFQFINSRYKNTPIAKEATVWILKSYIMLKRYNDAEALVSLLKNQGNFPPELMGLFSAASAEVYIKQQKYQQGLENMRTTLALTKKRSKKARYYYITAQLFERLDQPDSAKFYLSKVLKSNPTYDMAFNAKISLARNYNPADKAQVRQARRYLRSMLRDDKNISYYDQIYYQLGRIEQREGNTKDAIQNYRLSVQNSTTNNNQKAVSYLALADLYFNIPEYTLAQAYYDSTVNTIQPEFENYTAIVKKQSVLSELIKYKVIVAREDSLQFLATLPREELDKRIDRWIKDEAERRKRAEEEKEKQTADVGGGGGGFPGTPGFQPPGSQQPGGGSTGSNWYFYNIQQKSNGYNDFKRKWGNRKLTDDWRLSQKEKDMITPPGNEPTPDPENPQQADTSPEKPVFADVPVEKREYYRDIPFDPADKRLSDEKIANALFNIGQIYYERLGDVPEAIKAFSELLRRFPGHESAPKTYYYLYKIYKDTDAAKADQYKNLLISKYPDSNEGILVNDGSITRKNTFEIDPNKTDFYNATLGLFNSGRYVDVKMRKPVADTMLAGTALLPKYQLLYAMSVGKTDSIGEYKKQLDQIMEMYPATDIYRKAKELSDAIGRLQSGDSTTQVRDTREDLFTFAPTGPHFVIIAFPADKGDVNNIRIQVSNFNQSSYPDKTMDVQTYTLGKERLIIVRTFEGKDRANDYLVQVEKFHDVFVGIPKAETSYFIISAPNYSEMLKQGESGPYLTFYNRYYTK